FVPSNTLAVLYSQGRDSAQRHVLGADTAIDIAVIDILQDAANGTLPPVYNYLKDLPSLESEPTPILPVDHLKKTFQALASFDVGRGCPFQCSFCTIINVQGRKSRRRSADDVERTIREHYAQGIPAFFHHRRQSRPQQGLGGDLRPDHRVAR